MTELDLRVIGRVLAEAGITVTGPMFASRLAAGRSNWTYRVSDGTSSWLLRRPPSGGLTPSAHDIAREHRITGALRRVGVPVAEPLVLCEDASLIGAPFTLAAWVEGRTLQTADDLATLSDATLSTVVDHMVRQLAQLHQVDHVSAGLGDLARPGAYPERQLKRWSGQWQRVRVEELPDALALRARLEESVPAQHGVAVVHGDFRIDNVILGASVPDILAIVDWEMSTLGDPVADVALMASYRHPALSAVLGVDAAWASDRIPSGEELAASYEGHASVVLDDWEFYLALGFYKLAVIAQGIDHRYRAGATQGPGFDAAGSAVPDLFAAGLHALAGKPLPR